MTQGRLYRNAAVTLSSKAKVLFYLRLYALRLYSFIISFLLRRSPLFIVRHISKVDFGSVGNLTAMMSDSNSLQTGSKLGVVVHTNYDVRHPPPKPSPTGWTRFVCISDTHAHDFRVPDGDVLLHSGDLTNMGMLKELNFTAQWLYRLPHPIKIVIAGNHDLTLHKDWYSDNRLLFPPHIKNAVKYEDAIQYFTGPEARAAGVVYMEDSRCEFQAREGGRRWSVYGSPWSSFFGGWAFNYRDDNETGGEWPSYYPLASQVMAQIPPVDILLTHSPPYSILDMAQERTSAGSQTLLNHLPRIKPKLHVFGHIHEGRGATLRTHSISEDGYTTLMDDEDASKKIMDKALSSGVRNPSPGVPDFTVFVNAANQPTGSRARFAEGHGTGSFMPIIVDLLDASSGSDSDPGPRVENDVKMEL